MKKGTIHARRISSNKLNAAQPSAMLGISAQHYAIQWSARQGGGELHHGAPCRAVVRENQSRTGHGCLLVTTKWCRGDGNHVNRGSICRIKSNSIINQQEVECSSINSTTWDLKKPIKDVKHGMCCYIVQIRPQTTQLMWQQWWHSSRHPAKIKWNNLKHSRLIVVFVSWLHGNATCIKI